MSRSIHRRRMLQLLGGSLAGAGAYAGLGLAGMWQEQAIQRSRCDRGRLYDLHQELFGKWILLEPAKARRRHPRGGPGHESDARLDFLLELRRYLPDLAPPRRLPRGRPLQGVRVHQLDPGW